jgi:Na+/melibiose symporter-like transporter
MVFMLNMATTIIVILLSPPLARKFGKKAVCAICFALAAASWLAFYFLSPTNIWGMIGVSEVAAIVYAPSIPLTWAIFADTADYSEWKAGRRFTGMVFATIMFALKSGLALGSAAFLMVMKWFFQYDTKMPDAPEAVYGFRFCVGILTSLLFAVCTVLLACYPLSKRATIQMADELTERRRKTDGVDAQLKPV